MGVVYDFETGTAGSTQVTSAATIGASSIGVSGGTIFIQNDCVWSGTRNIQSTVTTANSVTFARFALNSNLTQSLGYGFRVPTQATGNLTVFQVRNSTGPALRINWTSLGGLQTADSSGATANPLTIVPAHGLTAGAKYFLQLLVTVGTATTGTVTATLFDSTGAQVGTVSSSTYNIGTTPLVAMDAGVISTNPVNTQVSSDYLVGNDGSTVPVAVPGLAASADFSGAGTLSATGSVAPGMVGMSGSGGLAAATAATLPPAFPLFGGSDSTTAVSASALTATISCPADVQVGDLLVGVFYDQLTGGTLTSGLTGWTAVTGMGVRTGGIYVYPIPDAATLSSLPASWTVNMSAAGRLVYDIFRVVGANLSSPVDVVGSFATQAATAVTIPGITTSSTNDLLLAISYWNSSSTTVSTSTPDSSLTDGQQVASPTSGNTSGIDIAWQQLGTPGGTGTRTVSTSPTGASNSGILLSIKSATSPLVSLTGAGSLTTVAVGPPAPLPVAMGSVGQLVTDVSSAVQKHLATVPIYVAHRGGSVDWPEETLYAYQQAAAWNSQMALEISLWQSSDGVWVCSHDQTTGRVFNQNLDIPSNSWATLSQVTSKVGGHPIARLEDILTLATGSRVFYIDNKPQVNSAALLSLLSSYGGPGRFIAKGYYSGTTWADAATAAGYQAWGYYYATDVSSGTLPLQSHWTLLGMDAVAPTLAAWQAAEQYGKKVLAHIIANTTELATAQQYRADGYMTSGVQEVVPQSPVSAALGSTGVLTTSGTPALQALAALSGGGHLDTFSNSSATGSADMSGTGTLQSSTSVAIAMAVMLSGSGSLTVIAASALVQTAHFSGDGLLAASGAAAAGEQARFSGAGTLGGSVIELVLEALVALAGSGQLFTVDERDQIGAASLSGSGSLSTTVSIGSTRAVVLETTQPAFRWKNELIANRWWLQQATARWATYRES